MQKTSRRVWPVVLAAVIITVLALGLVFGPDALTYFRAKNTQQQLQELYRGACNLLFPAARAEEIIPDPAVEVSQPLVVHEDFAGLFAQNQHLIGWLTAGGSIDYPVVQHDNEFYLEHDFYGKADINGTLFLNAGNRLSPRDSMLLIHGHNMKSGAMFGDLDFFRDYDYLSKYPIVRWRTIADAEDALYTPVAIFDASMNPDAEGYFNIGRIRFNFDVPPTEDFPLPRSTDLESHIAAMRALSFWTSPVLADSTDEYLALVSCSYNHDDGRLTLVCRKLRADETEESIRALYE